MYRNVSWGTPTLLSMTVLPILSNPWEKDSDGDEIDDGIDDYPLDRMTSDEKKIYDFYMTAKDYEIIFMVDFSKNLNANILFSVIATTIFRNNKDTNNIQNVISDFQNEGFKIDEFNAKLLLSEYELYSRGTSFAKLMEQKSQEWSEGMHIFLGMYFLGISEKLHPYDTVGNVKFDSRWFDENGNYKYPLNDGFKNGTKTQFTFKIGDQFDRYGSNTGRYASPVGTPYSQRSLGPYTSYSDYHIYEVVKPFEAYSGIKTPWGRWQGNGIQYKFENSIAWYISNGYIVEVY